MKNFVYFIVLLLPFTIYGQIDLLENGNIGFGQENPTQPFHFESSKNTPNMFYMLQRNGPIGERDVFEIYDADNAGWGQDHSSLIKLHKAGALDYRADGFSLLELTYTIATTPGHDDLYWVSAKDVDEGNPTWGITLHSHNFITEGGVVVGAIGNPNGTFSGGTSALLDNGNLGLHTINPQVALHVNGVVNRVADQTPSDTRLKANIESFEKGLDEVLDLNPITFSYDQDIVKSDRIHIGLSAQEVSKVIPEMVGSTEYASEKKSKDNYLNIYDSEIKYLLINAIKQQQVLIEELNNKVEDLLTQGSDATTKEIELIYTNPDVPVLYQNKPNPNDGITFIDYYIPRNTTSAKLIFFSMNGQLIKEETLEVGFNSIKINTKQLSEGRYTYSLEVDGELIDSKSMIVIE